MKPASDLNRTIDEIEEHLGIVVGLVRSMWKDAAAGIHPGLQPVGCKILGTLVRLGEANPYVLAEVLATDKSVISRQIRILEDAGLVVSRADANDGRARVLSAAPIAIERVREVRAQQHDRLRDILLAQPETEVRAFAAMLRRISES